MHRRSIFARLGLLGSASLAALTPGGPRKPKHPQEPDLEVFGVVRLLSDGPDILDDVGHTPRGLTEAFINSKGQLEITHTDLVVVGVSAVTPDETLVGRGMLVGNSQGFASGRLTFYSTVMGSVLDLNNPEHYKAVAGSTSNVWFYARANKDS